MPIRGIPATSEWICDFCMQRETMLEKPRGWGTIQINQTAFDFAGSPLDAADVGLVACNACLSDVLTEINRLLYDRRKP